MIVFIANLLTFILGLMTGYYGRQLYDKLNQLIETKREELLARQTGVVRVKGVPANPNEPIDLTASGSVVKRPTPALAEDQRAQERDAVLHANHS